MICDHTNPSCRLLKTSLYPVDTTHNIEDISPGFPVSQPTQLNLQYLCATSFPGHQGNPGPRLYSLQHGARLTILNLIPPLNMIIYPFYIINLVLLQSHT